MLISLFLLIISGASAIAQPGNDDCTGALAIACGETLSGTTVDANADAVGLCGTSATAPGVFYTFIGTGDEVTVSLCANTDYDSKLSVFEGDCAGLICVDGSDDACGVASEVTFNSVAGTTYFFYVHGFSSNTGNFDISVSCGSTGGDNCSAPNSIISDVLPPTTDQITVSTGSTDVITDLNVSIDITHTYIGDLTISLESPSGTSIILFQNCTSQDDMDAIFDDSGAPISCPPFGTLIPAQALASFIGESVDGIWTLTVEDGFAGDDGILNEWCLIPTLGEPIIIPNDLCADAISISCGETLLGTTLGAAPDDDVAGTCGSASVNSAGVWFKFIGDGSIVTASTCGAASYDTKIGVYTDGCGTLTCVDGNDDGAQCAGFTSEISFQSVDGVEYLILVHGFGGAAGDFALTISCEQPATNDLCADAIPVTCNQLISGSTVGTTADSAATCGTSNTAPGVWYSFTGTGDFVTVSTCGAASFDTKISVFSGACGAFTCVGGNDDFTGCIGFTSQFGFLSEAGTEYFILVHGFQDETGAFDLLVSCQTITVPNDFCTGALPIACGDVVTGSTIEATPESETACVVSNTAAGVWFSFTGDGSLVTATTCNAGNLYDTKISIYEGACGSLVCVNGNDDDASCAFDPFYSTVSWVANAGSEYLILVHGFSSETGDFELSLSCAEPLANDDCSGAVPVELTNGTPYTFTGSTIGGTASVDETNVLGAAAVWQAVTLTGDCNNLTVDYCGTPAGVMDFLFTVFTDCPLTAFTSGTLSTTGCPDGNGIVEFFNLPAGTYYLPVLADAGFIIPGDYTMTVLSEDCPPPPANDNCEDVEPVTLTLGTPVTFTGTTIGTTASPEEATILGAAAVWEAVTLTSPCNNLTIDYCGTAPENMATFFIVYTDCPVAEFTIGEFDVTTCADGNGTIRFTNIPAGTYYLPVLGDRLLITQGNYTMTVLAEDYVVTGYTLVNASTDQDIGPLQEGDIINLHNFPPFTIRADVCHPVGSMRFDLNGTFVRTESVIPYSLTGDAPTGNYRPWNPTPGAYNLTSTSFSGSNGSGMQLEVDDINFTIVNDDNCSLVVIDLITDEFGEETSWELVDLTDNVTIAKADPGTLASSTLFHSVFCVPTTHCFEFRIFDTFGDGICCDFGDGSYKITFGGVPVVAGGEFGASEITPFGNCNLDCAGIPGGSSVADVNGTCCLSSELDCDGVCFGGNSTGIAITSFTLIDALNDNDIGPLVDGATIDLALTGPISVRADVCNDESVESVRFFVNGNLFKIENLVFYSIAGDNSGNYAAWNVQPGVYTVMATPYSGDNGSGTAGTSYSVTITIINSSLKADPASLTINTPSGLATVKAFPNPFQDELTFEFSLPENSDVSLELFSISGVKIATVFEGYVKGDAAIQKNYIPNALASGMYMYRLKSNDIVITGRVTLAR